MTVLEMVALNVIVSALLVGGAIYYERSHKKESEPIVLPTVARPVCEIHTIPQRVHIDV